MNNFQNSATVETGRRTYEGRNLLQIGMPMGGIGAGCICLNGYGGLQDFSLHLKPATTSIADNWAPIDAGFGILHIKGPGGTTRLLEGPMPVEKVYAQGLKGQGYRQGGYEGLPRFESASFENGFPFGRVSLHDPKVPLKASVTGWNPFIPLDDVNSGMPCAILEYHFENTGTAPVDFEFSYHLTHLCHDGNQGHVRNGVLEQSALGAGAIFHSTLPEHAEKFGSAAVFAVGQTAQVKGRWFSGGWFDPVTVLWREVSEGRFQPNDGNFVREETGTGGGSVLIEGSLAPGESATYPVVIAWHFPNSYQMYDCAEVSGGIEVGHDGVKNTEIGSDTPLWRPFYAGHWEDAGAVARHAAQTYDELKARSQAFSDALFASTLPPEVTDAVVSNLAILKSPTILRQENGNVWAWEGCFVDHGSCAGTCTHVWNYAQAIPHLFPALERTLREQELERSMDERGHVTFRAALPDGTPSHHGHAAADGQLGGILKVYRDFHISGDEAWLRKMYPLAKRSLDYCIGAWDPDRRGLPFEPHHNTYDIEFWGADGMCGSFYIAALATLAQMARELGVPEEGASYRELAERGAALLDAELFNGEYYHQNVQWEGLRDTSVAEKVAGVTEASNDVLQLLKAEGPKYQYGTGCLSDGVIGAWMAAIYGMETPMNKTNVRKTLEAIYRHNFKADLRDHACTQRPGYAWGAEAGLLLCTWPHGDKLTLPFPYSDEVWTGIEYQVASHLMEEGLVDEALQIVRGARGRYDGHVRNPFNEYECGSYYARAMASYALLGSYSGFRYSAASKTLWFGPKVDGDFQCFFSTATGYGTIGIEGGKLFVDLIEGELVVEKLVLGGVELEWPVTATPGAKQWRDLPA